MYDALSDRIVMCCNYGPILYHFLDIQQRQIMACPRILGQDHLSSLKVAQVDRPCITSYQTAIVTIALFCIVFDLFDTE